MPRTYFLALILLQTSVPLSVHPIWDRLLNNGPAFLVAAASAYFVFRMYQKSQERNAARTDKIIDILNSDIGDKLNQILAKLNK
jgi:hypothetical protein